MGLVLGSILSLIFPFLTQAIVDYGIGNQNIDFVYLILIAQVILTLSSTAVGFIQGWIYLHIGSRIGISIISDFFVKLMNLPFSFFDSRNIGDILQRIGDHSRIQAFITSSSLSVTFSFMNLIVFGAILLFYSKKILIVFLVGNILYIIWVVIFLKRRKKLDYLEFERLSENKNAIIQMVSGIQEIKLSNTEKEKRWKWERIQAKLFKLKIKGLILSQSQSSGAVLINQIKNVFISFLAVKAVIDGEMTLGMMMSVQYILGQLQGPIDNFIEFTHSFQDAKISMERLNEIHGEKDEVAEDNPFITVFPKTKQVKIEQLSFQYEGLHSPFVLDNLELLIPENKVTAIVGSSGSGKSTLINQLN